MTDEYPTAPYTDELLILNLYVPTLLSTTDVLISVLLRIFGVVKLLEAHNESEFSQITSFVNDEHMLASTTSLHVDIIVLFDLSNCTKV